MRPLRVCGAALAAVAGLVGHASAQTCVVSNELLVLQTDVAQAQMTKYSNQLAEWTRIAEDLAPPDQLTQSFEISVDPEYLAALSDTDGDGVLTPAEIAADPEAAALASALQAQICAQLELTDCSQVQIQGIGGAPPGVGGAFQVDVTSEYQAALGLADTDGDGTLSPDELAADPTAAAMVAALQVSICDTIATCSDPSTISISQIANVASGGGGSVSNNLQLGVTDEFHAHLMEADTNGDGLLEPDEMAAHPTAASIVAAMQQSICDSIPSCTDPSTISIDGITSNAGNTGRRMLRSTDELVSVTLAQASVQNFGERAAFRDCVLTDSEIADNAAATSFTNAFGRVHGKPVTALRLPGCMITSDGKVSQKLMSERRVTMGWDHWTSMGGNQLPMTPEMIQANAGATMLAQAFAAAACTEFGLAAEQCPSIAVSLLYPVMQPDGSVEVRAAVGGHRGQLMLIAEVESTGR